MVSYTNTNIIQAKHEKSFRLLFFVAHLGGESNKRSLCNSYTEVGRFSNATGISTTET
jgi:hypothetical protein